MAICADFETKDGSGGAEIFLKGRLTVAGIGDLPRRLEEIDSIARIDISGLERIDTIGAWLVTRTARAKNAQITGANDDASHLLAAMAKISSDYQVQPQPIPAWKRLLGQLGSATIGTGREFIGIIGFFGSTIIAGIQQARSGRKLRWNSIVSHFQSVGYDALPIIGLMSFLIGIVVAQQGAVQLRQFGLEMFTINLVGRASIRELGLLMTAIMVAGRSGSAFAAQIGTMKLTEEIDAMRTIGVSPMEAIVLPRVTAAAITMPLLGFYASICAIVGGGAFCWVGLEIPPLTYIQRLREIIPMTDFWIMLIKAPIFGILIGITGCYEGMQVRQDAEQVGLRTTAAVVAAIFLVIVLDAMFAVFFSTLGWN